MAQERGYELIRRLASGGMGEVFVARRTAGDFEKRVALKLLLPHLVSPELVARFHAEARLAARMHHPNIVEIFDVGEADGRPFIAMQLVEGVSLSWVIKALGASGAMMPLPLVRLVASGICEALAYAHDLRDERGRALRVVHRDVTPSNILLSVAGAVQLTDFGIAKVRSDAPATEAGVIQGKIAYLSPEQVLHDAPIDSRSDVWSAAVTLAELLTLHNPFRAGTFEASLAALRSTAIQPVRARRPDVTPGIDAAISTALNRQQSSRFPDARSFRAALMDGPVATAPELGAWVRALGAGELTAEPATELGTGTRSIVEISVPPPALASPPRHGRAWALALAVLTVGGAGALWAWSEAAGPALATGSLEARVAPSRTGVASSGAALPPEPATRLTGDGPAVLEAAAATPSSPSTRRAADGRDALEPAAASPEPSGRRAEDSPAVVETAAMRPADGHAAVEVAAAAPLPLPGTAQPALPGRPAPTRPASAHAPARAPLHRSRQRLEPAPLRVGFLSADAVPWAEVSVDGKVIDRTPFARFPLAVGTHQIAFRGPTGQLQERTVVIAENAVEALRIDFTQVRQPRRFAR